MKQSRVIKKGNDIVRTGCSPSRHCVRGAATLVLCLTALLYLATSAPAQNRRSTPPSNTSRSSLAESAGPTPYPFSTPVLEPESSWWADLIGNKLVAVVFVVGLGLAVFGLLHFPNLIAYFRTRSRVKQRSSPASRLRRSTPLDALGIDTGAPIAPQPIASHRSASTQTPPDAKYQQTEYYPDKDRIDQLKGASISRQTVYSIEQPILSEKPPTQTPGSRHHPGDVVFPPAKSAPAKVPSSTKNGQPLEQLSKEEIAELKSLLDHRVSPPAQRDLSPALTNLEAKLTQTDLKLEMVTQHLEMLVSEQASLMETTRAELTKRVPQVAAEGAEVKAQLGGVLQEIGQMELRLISRLSDLESALDRQTVPDSFFAKTLGAVLGQEVEALRDGDFERLIGEKLNEFFQTGVDRGESLQETSVRAEAINAALRELSLQMQKLNSVVWAEARPLMQRFEEFVDELSGLRSQMQNRRATVQTRVRIPVSMYAGARQTFLQELGRGIKREINKLSEPQSYFASELKHLVTADIVAMVDICDHAIAHPASQPELEYALVQLFKSSGLLQILPRQGDQFKVAEQDLIEVAQAAGRAMTVAQVITRGFYYRQDGNETLLRKAGVSVYR